jgi:hypothetical protein
MHPIGIARSKRLVSILLDKKSLIFRLSIMLVNDILIESDLLATASLLNFLSIIWHSGTEGGVHHHTLSCFLTALVNRLSIERHQKSNLMEILLDSLLTALATLEGLRCGLTSNNSEKFRLWDDESIWKFAIDSSPSDLVVACQSDRQTTPFVFLILPHDQQPLLQVSSLLLQKSVCATHCLVQKHLTISEMLHFSSYHNIFLGTRNHLH